MHGLAYRNPTINVAPVHLKILICSTKFRQFMQTMARIESSSSTLNNIVACPTLQCVDMLNLNVMSLIGSDDNVIDRR